jgi:CxxC-x17-CxxC domain-containing protein
MSERVSTEIKCSDCGRTATVPFKPTAGKPVYCRECLAKHRTTKTRTTSSRSQTESDQKQAWSRRREGWKGQTEKSVPA